MEYHNQPKSGFDNGSLVYQYFCGNKDICLYNKWKTVCLCGNLSAIAYSKVQILWEGHKIWKNFPTDLTKPLFLLSSVNTSGRFLKNLVAFTEELNFNWMILTSYWFNDFLVFVLSNFWTNIRSIPYLLYHSLCFNWVKSAKWSDMTI